MGEEGEAPKEYVIVKEGAGDAPTSIGFTGKGKASYPNGDQYEGQYENGQRQGTGVYTYASGDIFTGTYEANEKIGKGRVDFADGGVYHGFFKDGKRHGEGTFKYSNGDIYSGAWAGGKKHGVGTYVYAGTKYKITGTWKAGQVTDGRWILTNGNEYQGAFANNKPSGDGLWKFPNGTVVEGNYIQKAAPVDLAPDEQGKAPATETKITWKTWGVGKAEA